MSEMVERVALALRSVVLPLGANPTRDWESIGEGSRRMYRREARTALESFRNATAPMKNVLMGTITEDDVDDVWNSVIDAALKD